MMELNYEITEQDFVDYNMYFIDHDLLTQKTLRRMRLIMAGLVIAGGALLMYLLDTLNAVSTLVYVALAAAVYWYAPRGFKNKARKNVHRTICRATNKHICGPKRLTADADGVRLTGEGEDSSYPYSAFKRVTEAERQVYLYLDDLSALIVPNGAFQDAEHKRSFLTFLRSRIEQAAQAAGADASEQDAPATQA